MVVDPLRGNIVYYGTDEQQGQLAALMVELGTEDERIVTREYILNHSDADTIADLLIGIITGERQTGDAPLLPESNQARNFGFGFGFTGEDASGQFDPDKISVIPDPDNNQVIIRAPIKQQEDLQKIITKIDRRKSQVYIEAMIVAVNDNEDFLLSIDTQFLGGEGGFGTNFGNIATPTAFTDPRTVAPGLGGLTAALIKSEYVPVVVNASQTNTDVRILSTPQLLVNDNQEAEIVSIEEQPFTELSQDGNTAVNSFGGYAEAGTTLRVTPSISKSGFLRLEYYVELSNFTSATGVDGSPPPRNTRRVEGSASVPTDSTIVLGGIVVDDLRDTIIKVPILGDIPILGEAFKRTNKVNNKSRLYIFLTPRIMTDPNFNDIRLFTEGPQREMSVDPLIPELEPAVIQSVDKPEPELPQTPWDEDSESQSSSDDESAPPLDPVFIEIAPVNSANGSDN
jgi:general secretion pathway protein D